MGIKMPKPQLGPQADQPRSTMLKPNYYRPAFAWPLAAQIHAQHQNVLATTHDNSNKEMQ